ncbi:MAG: ABC transporter substrate-binding protein [Paludibacteraceae bacterium]|nr:ABC transporter substrate-binding protein [Paludibacteraceae bacterium]
MVKIIKYSIIAVLLVAFSNCNTHPFASTPARENELCAPDSSWGENQAEYANGFTLYQKDNIYRVAVRNPWDSLRAMAVYYFTNDTTTITPTDGKRIANNGVRIAATSATHYTPLELLGCIDRIVSICSPDRAYNKKVKERYAEGKIRGLGENYNINKEALLGSKANLVIISKYEEVDQSESFLKETGISTLFVQEWQENSLLGRAEWIKVMGAAVGEKKLADSLFHTTALRYDSLKSIAKSVKKRPKIMGGCGYRGTWYVPGGQSYMARLYTDAGGDYYYATDTHTGSLSVSLESILQHFADADIWLGAQAENITNETDAEPRIKVIQPIKTGEVYHYNRRKDGDATDFWEGAVSHPDSLLGDVIKALHPELMPEWEWVYVKKLSTK